MTERIDIAIFREEGKKLGRTLPVKTAYMNVKIFGNAERISCYSFDNKRIGQFVPEECDLGDYKGAYVVFIEDIEDWKSACNGLSTPVERRDRFKEILNGHD